MTITERDILDMFTTMADRFADFSLAQDAILAHQDTLFKTTAFYKERIAQMDSQLAACQQEIAHLKAEVSLDDCLQRGLLPENFAGVSLLEIQIFHTPVLTKAQRQGRHTEWSLKLEVHGTNGRRRKQDIDVSLYTGRQFANQVFDAPTDAVIPQQIANLAEHLRDDDSGNELFGMLAEKTNRQGTPRNRQQFCVLTGHLIDKPHVYLRSHDTCIGIGQWRRAGGTKQGHALWYQSAKPTTDSIE
jgi:hypothetical protein